MNPEPIPQDLLAVHDLLRETLANARDNGGPFQYGVAVFPRTGRFGAPVFGIATSGGESTVLTYRMLQSLVELPVYISGRVPATIREGLSYGPPRVIPVALLDQPVLRIGFTCCIGASRDDLDRTQPLETSVFAGDLTAPIILLLDARPDGWPH
jgi:hypothetical protein